MFKRLKVRIINTLVLRERNNRCYRCTSHFVPVEDLKRLIKYLYSSLTASQTLQDYVPLALTTYHLDLIMPLKLQLTICYYIPCY